MSNIKKIFLVLVLFFSFFISSKADFLYKQTIWVLWDYSFYLTDKWIYAQNLLDNQKSITKTYDYEIKNAKLETLNWEKVIKIDFIDRTSFIKIVDWNLSFSTFCLSDCSKFYENKYKNPIVENNNSYFFSWTTVFDDIKKESFYVKKELITHQVTDWWNISYYYTYDYSQDFADIKHILFQILIVIVFVWFFFLIWIFISIINDLWWKK